MTDESRDIFTGVERPVPHLDIVTIQETRLRVIGMLFARQVEVLLTQNPDAEVPQPKTDAELIQAVRKIGELLLVKQERNQEAERNFGQFLDLLDDMEAQALKQVGD